MTENTKTKYEKVIALKQQNPTWSTKKCCERAKISVPSYYEAKKEIIPVHTKIIKAPPSYGGETPIWKQIVKSNLSPRTKMELLNSL